MSHRYRILLAISALAAGMSLLPSHAHATDAWASREEARPRAQAATDRIDFGLPGGTLPAQMKPSWYLSPQLAPKKQVRRGPASDGGIWPREFVDNVVEPQAEPDPSYQPVSDSFKRRMGY